MKFSSSTALAAAALLSQGVVAQNSGKFDFLTLNVAGLPDIINDNGVPGDKRTNSQLIGQALGRENHDIVHLQEDFNYHAAIYETISHPHRTPTSGGVPFGDGLNSLSNFPWTAFERTKWRVCSINSGDCLTPKGFSWMKMPFAGFELHMYNLHADAGSNSQDVAARSAGIDQLLEHIGLATADEPVIIAGDFNDRWTNSGVSIDKLTRAGFRDPWVDLVKNGVYPAKGSPANACVNPAPNNDCEIVDKIFYRPGKTVSLTATSFNYIPEDFLQPNGDILTDHNPVLVNFDWAQI